MRTLALGLAGCLALVVTAPTPARADGILGGGNFAGKPGAPDACTQSTNKIMTQAVQIADVTDNIQIVCNGGQAFFRTSSGPSRPGPTLPVGASCTATWYSSVSTSPITSNGFRQASWQPPPGAGLVAKNTTQTLISANDLNAGSLSAAQPQLYTNLVFAIYQEQGTWDGSNCTGGNWSECGHTSRPEGMGTSFFDPCITMTSYAPNPPDCTAACEQPVVTLIGQISGHFDAGHLQRWPQAAQPPKVGPVVNVPVQFYIPDWSFNATQQALRRWALTLVGPPDPLGRSRVFTYLVTAGLQGIDWSFGDGQSAHFADASGFGQNIYPPNGSSTVNHPYTQISGLSGYHVTATENWGVRVDEYWIGGHTEVTALETTLQVSASTDVAVGQVEPIPCSGPGCV